MFLVQAIIIQVVLNRFTIFLGSLFLLTSCCKDTEKLTPISDCKIISNYSKIERFWRYINYNADGKISSYVNQDYTYVVVRDYNQNELMINAFLDTTIYRRIADTIVCVTPKNKVIKRLILNNNLIARFEDSLNDYFINYTYSDGLMLSETRYTKAGWKVTTRDYTYDDTDLWDFQDVMIHQKYIIHFENRIVSEFFNLKQKYRRYKDIRIQDYIVSGGKNYHFKYSYLTNERNLVTHKIVEESLILNMKDTVSYVYTCKY